MGLTIIIKITPMLLAILVGSYAAIQAPMFAPSSATSYYPVPGGGLSRDCTRQTCPQFGTKCVNDPTAGWAARCIDVNDGMINYRCAFGYDCFDWRASCLDLDEKCYPDQVVQCITDTRDAMVAIKNDYQTTGVTTRSAKVGDTLMVFDDFSTNKANNRAYEYACKDKRARYVELHYTATCEAPAVAGSTKQKVVLFVSGQPRCYSTLCDGHYYNQYSWSNVYSTSLPSARQKTTPFSKVTRLRLGPVQERSEHHHRRSEKT